MKNKLTIPLILVSCISLVFMTAMLKLIPAKAMDLDDYKKLTVGQLIDLKMWLSDQLSWLNKDIFYMDTVICSKASSLCVLNGETVATNTGTAENPVDQLNQSMGLK